MSPYRLLREPRAADASMDLLNRILRTPIDPDYAVVAARRAAAAAAESADATTARPVRQRRWSLLAVAAVIGLLFTIAGQQTLRHAPVARREHVSLAERVASEQRRRDTARQQLSDTREAVRTLRTSTAIDDEQRRLGVQIETVGAFTGALAVMGPGVRITVDDAADDSRDNRVLDRDLQQLASALWESGAEAIAINGHRLTGLTAIRSAGDAITVDYRSLVRPYTVEAIGNPGTLGSRLKQTAGGRTWQNLHDRYGLRFEVAEANDLRLPPDPGLTLKHARRMP